MRKDEVLEIQARHLDAANKLWSVIGVREYEDTIFWCGLVDKDKEGAVDSMLDEHFRDNCQSVSTVTFQYF
jgi:hypothetical protein